MAVFQPPEAQSKETAPSAGGSRFKQWFSRQSPTNATQPDIEDSRRSSLQEDMMHSIMKSESYFLAKTGGLTQIYVTDLSEPNVAIPALGSTEAYFAPISPAASGSSGPAVAQSLSRTERNASLLEMLQRSHQPQAPDKNPSIKDLGAFLLLLY